MRGCVASSFAGLISTKKERPSGCFVDLGKALPSRIVSEANNPSPFYGSRALCPQFFPLRVVGATEAERKVKQFELSRSVVV